MSQRKPGKIEKGITEVVRAVSKGRYLGRNRSSDRAIELGVDLTDRPGKGAVSERAAARKRDIATATRMEEHAGPAAPGTYPLPDYKNMEKIVKNSAAVLRRKRQSGK